MKRLLLLVLISLHCIDGSHCQNVVKTMPTKNDNPTSEIIPYDSLSNIRFGENFKKYLGQEILFYELSANSDLNVDGYENFKVHPTIVKIDTLWHNGKNVEPYEVSTKYSDYYKATFCALANTKNCGVSNLSSRDMGGYTKSSESRIYAKGYSTPLKEINGKKFTIIDVDESTSYYSKSTKFMLLSSEGNAVYWFAEPNNSLRGSTDCYPVILTGLIDKYKSMYIGKGEFYIKAGTSSQTPCAYKTDGTIITLYSDVKLEFIDIHFVDIFGIFSVPCFFVKTENQDELYIPLCKYPRFANTSIREPERSTWSDRWVYMEDFTFKPAEIVYKERANLERQKAENHALKLKKKEERKNQLYAKYGKSNADLILQGKVLIGMTKAMCIESWGRPSDINTTTGSWGVHEQWVYNLSTYLYFENGKLTAIQN